MPIRVLHVVTYMGRAGLETMLMNYYRNIDRDKVQFDFLTHRDFESDYDQEIKSLGGKVYHLPVLNPFSHSYLKALNNFFLEHPEYEIVHCHLDCLAGIPLKYAKKNGVPIRIAHSHNSNQVKNLKYLIKLACKGMITKYATNLFACSKAAGDWMFRGASYTVINNAIDTEKYKYDENVRNVVRKEFNISSDEIVIGHVGRFNPQKNHELLIEIFATLEKQKNAKLLLVGDGELMDSIKEKVKELSLQDSVIFTGVREDVSRLLQAMDVFVLPSNFEGLPLVIVEAQAAGLPCVISNKVPVECRKIENLVTQVNLNAELEEWVLAILKMAQIIRSDTHEDIKKVNFDIIDQSKKLQEFYCHITKELA